MRGGGAARAAGGGAPAPGSPRRRAWLWGSPSIIRRSPGSGRLWREEDLRLRAALVEEPRLRAEEIRLRAAVAGGGAPAPGGRGRRKCSGSGRPWRAVVLRLRATVVGGGAPASCSHGGRWCSGSGRPCWAKELRLHAAMVGGGAPALGGERLGAGSAGGTGLGRLRRVWESATARQWRDGELAEQSSSAEARRR
ncbi:unnamed protein product [Urochloa humidicola]